MSDTVFISHATPADNTFAVWLATKLELCGYKVWVDVNNLAPSDDFWVTIDNVIRNETVKFIFVVSSASINPNRDGIQKELAVADKVRRQNPNFIIPVRIDDVSFSDVPVEILRLNAIDFYNNWASGLTILLKHLCDEKVPMPYSNNDSQYYVDRWSTSQSQIRSQITDDKDEYCSNFFSVDLPPYVYVYMSNDVEQVLKARHIPVKKDKKVIVTFACNKCLHDWCGNKDIDFVKLQTAETVQNCTSSNIYLGETISNLSHDVVSLINWTVGELFYKHGLRRYKTDSGKTSRNVYYFPFGTKSKRSENSRAKSLSGVYRKIKRWHFGLSGYFTQYPTRGIIIKWHLIFTDNNGQVLSDASQIAARRSKGRLMFNKQWKEWLLASMYFLAGGSSNIFYATCCEENAIYIKRDSTRFIAEKSYVEPYIYRQVENEDDDE